VRYAPALVVLLWAGLLAALAAMLWIWDPEALVVALLGGAAAATAVLAAVVARRARRPGSAEIEIPDLSIGAAVAAIALATMLVGAEAGLFLVLIGAGLLLFALIILARELA
jgi:exfoliative toxin A/B